ncbi:MAG: histidine phosphatase family protein [Gammaproteobacteria bacterium]|nr:histidine phosphatase family protein [Rhodocyclaceae bacterium]MBU3908290.1 histidine phosphatase family protein [Gammaproteobacteria bacterium]MBU3988748.1 histidine phosphatase family protein [Gammaproteobacteria bacterium]MBU4003073.1 histidine phosphatase family protein [Gammaproteobacteria bacterium]MBU4019915.1 histidine phosphatase family protein [Gammaproteobacteria bacterium]
MSSTTLATRLCVVRHGETDWNAGRRIQGHIDVPLSVVGHTQARAAGNTLANEGFAAIYSSDLTRARQTAEATAHLAHVPLHLLTGLRERHYGVFQGLTYAEAEAQYPEAYARHHARDNAHFAFPGGESLHDLAVRIGDVCDDIISRHAGGAVAIFTHGGVLDIMHRRAAGKPLTGPRDFAIPNAAINWIEIANDRWTILNWAERGHLTGALEEL